MLNLEKFDIFELYNNKHIESSNLFETDVRDDTQRANFNAFFN